MLTRLNHFRFNRQEFAGSFGDLGTDLPLILAMIPAAGLDFTSTFVMFGLMQILSGLLYQLPMPMQPLKAMAIIVITQKVSAPVLFGGGLAIGAMMLLLTALGLLNWLVKIIPHHVVRGLQLGLGISLASLALKNYVPQEGIQSYGMALIAFLVLWWLKDHRRFPGALLVMGAAALWMTGRFLTSEQGLSWDFRLPIFQIPQLSDMAQGLVLLALPQLPLSLSNSVIATHRTIRDFFPERGVKVSHIGWSYALINLISPFFCGIPVCHGCGGLAGHYALGARTGTSVIIYGSFYVILGLFFSSSALALIQLFPRPLLGAILLIESLALMKLVGDVSAEPSQLVQTLLVGVVAAFVPQGFLVALILGLVIHQVQRS